MPEPAPAPPTIVTVRVAYGDVDKMGVVYYGNYLRWFELGRAEYLRARGRPYKDIEADGVLLPVVEAYARYREPARYDDLVEVHTTPEQIGQVRLTFAYRITRTPDGAFLAEGRTVHCCTGPSGRPRRFPKELLDLLKGVRSPSG